MSESKLKAYIEEAAPIIESFLAQLLKQDSTFQTTSATEVEPEALYARAQSDFTIVSKDTGASTFAIQIEPNWIPLISTSILGAPMAPEDTGVADLANQMLSQGYKALRTDFSAGSLFLDTGFEAFGPQDTLSQDIVTGKLWKIPFRLLIEDQVYSGAAFIAEAAISSTEKPAETVGVAPVDFPDLGREKEAANEPKNFDLLAEVELNVTVELGRRRIPLSEVLQLTTGSVIELEKLVGEPLEIFANGRLIAEGEAVVVDEQFGVRITNLASTNHRANAFA